jgi:hypothetical protein
MDKYTPMRWVLARFHSNSQDVVVSVKISLSATLRSPCYRPRNDRSEMLRHASLAKHFDLEVVAIGVGLLNAPISDNEHDHGLTCTCTDPLHTAMA